ncbi:DUF736 domain-containing protein [Glycocaulis profundi]|nr:DUF736 domain-containing protein [Glycocaulis profundi]
MRSMVIGQFRRAKDGWTGEIRTPGFSHKVRLVPNDNRTNPNAPAYRLMIGWIAIGNAWDAKTAGERPREYFRVSIDGPLCPAPIECALFPDADELSASLLWKR